ncbi:hypothetical protein [Streptosporangium carneum]|uniref:Uncharacterized protein n=1 Tax=Streptosporangium carneum TaxID=47481 RepID=A0A9W6MGN0_9ACTN|nr:hypothetical protein [Streptosporangium carneum]GLK13330.1 hypothetical protein GCM10017600_67410 [Streptosporangium carneum]
MALEENGRPAGNEPVEALIDDLLRDILGETGPSTKTRARGGDSIATLIETAIASPRATSKTSTVERLLIAQVVASALADALAPALAESLAPEIMKALEHHTADGRSGNETVPVTGRAQTSRSRKKA